jgi:hypothetical protein
MDLRNNFRRSRALKYALAFLFTTTPLVGSPCAARANNANKGELGGDLSTLALFHTSPLVSGESNHYIDMWSGGKLIAFAREHGLTNNRALFVISHARGVRVKGKQRYALYPGQTRITRGFKTPYYSPQDMARMLGSETVRQVDNLIISGCDSDNVFSLSEWKCFFPKATNIIHAAPGKDAYDILLRHALMYRSDEIKWLYGMPDSFTIGRFDDDWTKSKDRPRLNLYLASLYAPQASVPFTVQIAGRELLERPARRETAKVGSSSASEAKPVEVAHLAASLPKGILPDRRVRSQPVEAIVPAAQQTAVAAPPKTPARREPIIMRGPNPRPEPRRAAVKSFQPRQGEAALGILGVVFGGCCIAWSFGFRSQTDVAHSVAHRRAHSEEPTTGRLSQFVSERLRRFRQLLKKRPRSEEPTSQTSDVESPDPVD